MLSSSQIKGKWAEIKGWVWNLWGEITEDEIEQTKGNLYSLTEIVQQKYGESKESIIQKLDRLIASFDNETDKSLKINDGEASYQRNPTGVRSQNLNQVDTDEIYNESRPSEDRISRH